MEILIRVVGLLFLAILIGIGALMIILFCASRKREPKKKPRPETAVTLGGAYATP